MRALFVAASVLLFLFLNGLDYGNSCLIATCKHGPGYEELGKKCKTILTEHGIVATLTYAVVQPNGGVELTDDANIAQYWMLYVSQADSQVALNVLKQRLSLHSKINFYHKNTSPEAPLVPLTE
jgi:hypothetical protein